MLAHSIVVCQYVLTPTRTREGLERVLAVFDEVAWTPDHCGGSEFARDLFDREAFVSLGSSERADGDLRFLRRKSNPAWEGSITFCNDRPALLGLTFEPRPSTVFSPEQARTIFESASAVAARLGVAYGYTFARVGVDRYDNADYFDNPERYGLRSLYARNWFGASLVRRLGPERVLALGANRAVHGGVEVDLVPDPWSAPWEAIQAAADARNHLLQEAGLLGLYQHPLNEAPPGWAGLG